MGYTHAYANGVNDSGQIVGSTTDPGQNSRAFLYTPGSGVTDLGTWEVGQRQKQPMLPVRLPARPSEG